MKTIHQSIYLSGIINILYLFGGMAIAYVQTVLYEPDFTKTGELSVLDSAVAFGSTGNFLPVLSIRTCLGALLIFVLLKIFAKWRTVKS